MERGGAKRRMNQQQQDIKATFQKIREKLNIIEGELQEMRKILRGEKP